MLILQPVSLNVRGSTIESSTCEKLLGLLSTATSYLNITLIEFVTKLARNSMHCPEFQNNFWKNVYYLNCS